MAKRHEDAPLTADRFLLMVTYNLSVNSKSPAAYTIGMAATDLPVAPLAQTGPVWNNVISLRGVFPSKNTAAGAALEYVNGYGLIREITDVLTGAARQEYVRHGAALTTASGYTTKILASRNQNGEFLAFATKES